MADVTAEERRIFASRGWAMPDGSFYIRPDHPEDLTNAVSAVGRATATGTPRATDEAQREAVRRHIMKRARELKRTSEIPDTWNANGTLKQSSLIDEIDAYLARFGVKSEVDEVSKFLLHFGVRGMRWGIRRASPHTPGLPSSHDAAVAAVLSKRVAKAGSTRTLTNAELRQLVTRMNLEKQYADLSKPQVNAGEKAVKGIVSNAGKQLATQFIVNNAPKAGEYAAKILMQRLKK